MTTVYTAKSYLHWFDDQKKKSVEDKIREGAAYFYEKYAKPALVCHVSAKDLAQLGPQTHVGRIEVSVSQYVRPDHFMIGVE